MLITRMNTMLVNHSSNLSLEKTTDMSITESFVLISHFEDPLAPPAPAPSSSPSGLASSKTQPALRSKSGPSSISTKVETR